MTRHQKTAATWTLLTIAVLTAGTASIVDPSEPGVSSVTNQPLGDPIPYRLTDDFHQAWESTDLRALRTHIARRNSWKPMRWNADVVKPARNNF